MMKYSDRSAEDKKRLYECNKRWRSRNKATVAKWDLNKRLKRLTLIREAKHGGCKDCGTFIALTLDHVSRDKKARKANGNAIIAIKDLGTEKIKQEIEKCECVCQRCHRIRTIRQNRAMNPNPNKNRKGRKLLKYVASRLKTFYGCELCGYNNAEFPSTLDFDHTDPSAKQECVSQMYDGDMESMLAEIAKCRVLCANCHFVKHSVKDI